MCKTGSTDEGNAVNRKSLFVCLFGIDSFVIG